MAVGSFSHNEYTVQYVAIGKIMFAIVLLLSVLPLILGGDILMWLDFGAKSHQVQKQAEIIIICIVMQMSTMCTLGVMEATGAGVGCPRPPRDFHWQRRRRRSRGQW